MDCPDRKEQTVLARADQDQSFILPTVHAM
jgi:hypothetical protein